MVVVWVYCMQYLVKTATERVSLVVYEENYVIGDGDDDESEGYLVAMKVLMTPASSSKVEQIVY